MSITGGVTVVDIVVCMKQTFDTEERVTVERNRIREAGVKFVINPYDEYAIEEAIRLKEENGGSVVVVSIGPDRVEESLRVALAMGADEAVLVDDPSCFGDEYTASKVLAAVIRQRPFDIIVAGNQAVDDGSGQVAVRLAVELGIAHMSTLTKLTISDDGRVEGHRDAEGDVEVVNGNLPILVTAQQGLNEPRYPSLIGIRKANKKPISRLSRADLGLTEEEIKARTTIAEIFPPQPKQAGRILAGPLESQVTELVQALKTVNKVVGQTSSHA